jgi:molecular chaperone GrpE
METNQPRGEATGSTPDGAATTDQEEVQVKWRKKDDAGQNGGAETSSASDEPTWEERYRGEQTKAETYLGNWQRAQADLANLRRRNQQEREDYIKRANEELIRDLLPVLDSFDQALSSVPAHLREQAWVDGVIRVERQLRMALLRHGVTAIEAEGQRFDPTQHEAVMHKETTEHEDEAVTAELRRGYKLHDRVLRPSMVEVAKNSGAGTSATAHSTQTTVEEI